MNSEYLRICLIAALMLQCWFFIGLIAGAYFFKGRTFRAVSPIKMREVREREEKAARIWENIENYATDAKQKEV